MSSIKGLITNYYQVIVLIGFIIFVVIFHLFSENTFQKKHVFADEAGEALLHKFSLDEKYGADGYFSQAVRNGYNIFFDTPNNASRFTGNGKSCSGCHTVEDMAYAFVTMDRFNQAMNMRISFEEQIRRCYVGKLDGHVPAFFDPALQDIKIFARFMSIALKLQEGFLRSSDE